MSPVELLTLEMINILFMDKNYTEALVGLRLLRKSRKDRRFHRLVDNLISVIQSAIKDSSDLTSV
jgi:hypothetical protein